MAVVMMMKKRRGTELTVFAAFDGLQGKYEMGNEKRALWASFFCA